MSKINEFNTISKDSLVETNDSLGMSEKKPEPISNSHKRFRKSENNKASNQCHETSNNSIEQSQLENELENANEENSPNNQFNDETYEEDDDDDEEDEYGNDDQDYQDHGSQFANNESFNDYHDDEFESEESTTKLAKKESSSGGQVRSNKRKRNLSPIPGSTASKSNSNSSTNISGFEIYEKSDCIQVNCNSFIGELYKSKFGSGGKGSCIRVLVEKSKTDPDEKNPQEKWMTPIEFESYCGKGNCRDWKRTIKVGGQSLVSLLEKNILVCHAVSCSCAACNKNESLVGPIRPFTRYRRRKKDEILAQNAFKKFLSLKPPTLLQESLIKIQNNNAEQFNKNLKLITSMQTFSEEKLPASIESNVVSQSAASGCSETQKKSFFACLEELDETEDKSWSFLEQETKNLMCQAQNLHSLIQQTRRQCELNRKVLMKKFLN